MTILPILPYYDSLCLCVLTQQPDGPRLFTITLITADVLLPSHVHSFTIYFLVKLNESYTATDGAGLFS